MRDGLLGVEPSLPAVVRGVEADLGEQAVRPAMVTVLQPLEVSPHAPGAPGGIAGEAGEVVPVRIVRIEEDHRVVGGAAAQGPRPRIEDAVDARALPRLTILGIPALGGIAPVVAAAQDPTPRCRLC